MWIGLLFSELADPGHGNYLVCLFVFPTRVQILQDTYVPLNCLHYGGINRHESHKLISARACKVWREFQLPHNVLVSAQNVFG
jgi:hypothetical protein